MHAFGLAIKTKTCDNTVETGDSGTHILIFLKVAIFKSLSRVISCTFKPKPKSHVTWLSKSQDGNAR